MTRILVVEDEPAVTEAMRMGLQALGYTSYCCVHPGEAVHHLAESRFDVVLSDLMMPGMSGLELAIEVKKSGCKIPFVIITGSTIEVPVEVMKENNIRFLLRKPVPLDELDYALKRSIVQ